MQAVKGSTGELLASLFIFYFARFIASHHERHTRHTHTHSLSFLLLFLFMCRISEAIPLSDFLLISPPLSLSLSHSLFFRYAAPFAFSLHSVSFSFLFFIVHFLIRPKSSYSCRRKCILHFDFRSFFSFLCCVVVDAAAAATACNQAEERSWKQKNPGRATMAGGTLAERAKCRKMHEPRANVCRVRISHKNLEINFHRVDAKGEPNNTKTTQNHLHTKP